MVKLDILNRVKSKEEKEETLDFNKDFGACVRQISGFLFTNEKTETILSEQGDEVTATRMIFHNAINHYLGLDKRKREKRFDETWKMSQVVYTIWEIMRFKDEWR